MHVFKPAFALGFVFTNSMLFAQNEEMQQNITDVNKDTCGIIVPKAFSPNGDGIDDILYIKTFNVSSFSFELFNRWGEEVYTTTDVNAGWDGKTKKGKYFPKATYIYLIGYECQQKKQKPLKGYIELK